MIIDIFEHKDTVFVQKLFTEEDDRVEMQDEDGKVFVTFTAHCEIILQNQIVGRIHQHNTTLHYAFNNDYENYLDTNVPVRDAECYLKAEKQITLYLAKLAEDRGVTIPELVSYLR